MLSLHCMAILNENQIVPIKRECSWGSPSMELVSQKAKIHLLGAAEPWRWAASLSTSPGLAPQKPLNFAWGVQTRLSGTSIQPQWISRALLCWST